MLIAQDGAYLKTTGLLRDLVQNVMSNKNGEVFATSYTFVRQQC